MFPDAASANVAGDAEDDDPEVALRLRENAVTMNKMSDLRAQMERLNLARRQKKVRVGRKVYYDDLDLSLVFSRFSERCAGCPLRGRAACRQRPVLGHPEVQGRWE